MPYVSSSDQVKCLYIFKIYYPSMPCETKMQVSYNHIEEVLIDKHIFPLICERLWIFH